MSFISEFDRERLERAARIYASNNDAGAALGINPSSFGRLCRQYGIETPQGRRRRERQEVREGRQVWETSKKEPASTRPAGG